MAINHCDLCSEPCVTGGQIGNNNMQEIWRTLVAQALCTIAGASTFSVQLAQVGKTAAQLTSGFSTYADLGFLDTSKRLKRLTVLNGTDADIEISLDGGVSTHLTVPAGTSETFDLGNQTFSLQSDLRIRLADPATTGSVYFSGGY